MIADEVLDSAYRMAAALLEGIAVVDQYLPDSTQVLSWISKMPSLPAGLTYTAQGLGALLGAWSSVFALRDVLADAAAPVTPSSTIAAVEFSAIPRRNVTLGAGFRGLRHIHGGWLSLSVHGDHQLEVYRAATAALGEWFGEATASPPLGDIAAVADHLQQWGVAALEAGEAQDSINGSASGMCARLSAAPLAPTNRLRRVRVLDMGQLISGTWTSELLGAAGADVIALSHPRRASQRWYGPTPLQLDLNRPDDRVMFSELCQSADILVDNFRPRVWRNLGLDPIELGATVHLTLPAFRSDSPRHNYKAFGFQTEARFGVGVAPLPGAPSIINAPQVALLDHTVGFAGAAAAMCALVTNRHGKIEISHEWVCSRSC